MEKDIKEEIKELCIGGLLTDGAHHKQWYLEKVLVALGYRLDEVSKELSSDDCEWEEGIAP